MSALEEVTLLAVVLPGWLHYLGTTMWGRRGIPWLTSLPLSWDSKARMPITWTTNYTMARSLLPDLRRTLITDPKSLSPTRWVAGIAAERC